MSLIKLTKTRYPQRVEAANPYKGFDKFIYRIPFLTRQFSDSDFVNHSQFKEAIFLASRDLYDELYGTNKEEKNITSKQFFSRLKYLTRMRTRCTPFGLFAGVGIGRIRPDSQIWINRERDFRTNTRLDIRCLIGIVNKLLSIPDIRNKIIFFPNNSIYPLVKTLRFAEYFYHNGKRDFQLSEIEADDDINTVLSLAESGSNLNDLTEALKRPEIDEETVTDFIEQLLQNQILTSELEPRLTGGDLLQYLLEVLTRIKVEHGVLDLLRSIQTHLEAIDSADIGSRMEYFRKIEQKVAALDPEADRKHIFQCDLSLSTADAGLSKRIVEEVRAVIPIFNKLTVKKENPMLSTFKERFYERFEEQELPLSLVLDSDIGVLFNESDDNSKDLNPLLSDIPLNVAETKATQNFERETERLLYAKFLECRRNNLKEILLEDEDLSSLSSAWEDLPDSLSAIVDIIATEQHESGPLLVVNGFAGASCANLIARFAHTDREIADFCCTMIKEENDDLEPGKIFAEIVHLPDDRLGNVMIRPAFHQYEIPYLANPSCCESHKISIGDLYISVPNKGRVKLRSKKLNKEIVPRLTTAHNFYQNTLPIYQFLCLLQSQDLKSEIYFDWGDLLGDTQFFPRLRYRHTIISPAKWKVTAADLIGTPHINSPEFYPFVLDLKKRKGISDEVFLVLGDNKLLINLNIPGSAQLLFATTKGRSFLIEEYLIVADGSLAKTGAEEYNCQVVLCYHKCDTK